MRAYEYEHVEYEARPHLNRIIETINPNRFPHYINQHASHLREYRLPNPESSARRKPTYVHRV